MNPAFVQRALLADDAELGEALLALRENQWFERKSGQISPKDLAATLVAFANAEGGTVAVGLSEGRVNGVPDNKENDLRQTAMDFTEPSVRSRVESRFTPEGRILVFSVEPGEHVHETARGECFLRVGDESRRLNFLQRQELEYDRGPTPFDGTVSAATFEDLDEARLDAYRELLGSSGVAEVLQARSLITRDRRLTVAACLLFATDPGLLYPQAYVRVLQYLSDERGAGGGQNLMSGGDIRFGGPLAQQVEDATEEIQRRVPSRRALGPSGQFEDIPMIPRDAWLEGLVNAVVHRSYANAGDHIRVEIFPTRIEISSPGRFPGLVDPANPLRIGRHARNPRIARVFSDLGITQELGEGIRRIFAEMRSRGLTEPSYEQTASSVRLVLRASDALPEHILSQLSKGALATLEMMRRVRQPLSTGQVAELVNISRPTTLRHLRVLRDNGIVTRHGNAPTDPRATWTLS